MDSTDDPSLAEQACFMERLLIGHREAMTQLRTVGLDEDAANKLKEMGVVVDGRGGGLLLGADHDDFGHVGIWVLMREDDERLRLQEYSVEGGEYLLTVDATQKYTTRIHELNRYSLDEITQHTQKANPWAATRVVDVTVASPVFIRLLWVDSGQAVVNRKATFENLAELEKMNAFATSARSS